MRGDGGNHHEKLELRRISCASQFTIPDTAGTSPYPACNYTDTRSSQPNQASHTADFSYPLVSSTLFSSSSPSLSFSFTTLPSMQHTKLSQPSLSLHAMIMSLHWVQHTPSTTYTGYSIHPRLFVFPSSSWLRFDLWMLVQLPACLPTRSIAISQLSMRAQIKGKVTCSHSHGCKSTNWWIQSQHPARCPSTASKYSSNLARSRPPSVSLKSLDHGLQVYLQTGSITACKFGRSRPPSASPNSLDHGLQVYLQTRSMIASKCISKFDRLRPRSSLDPGLQVDLQILSITASKCISKLARSRPRSVSLSSVDRHFQAHL